MKVNKTTLALCALPTALGVAARGSSKTQSDHPVSVLRAQSCMDVPMTTIPLDELCASRSDCSVPAAIVHDDSDHSSHYHPNLVQVWTHAAGLDCVDLGFSHHQPSSHRGESACRHHAISSLGDSAFAVRCTDMSDDETPSLTTISLTSSVSIFALVTVCYEQQKVH